MSAMMRMCCVQRVACGRKRPLASGRGTYMQRQTFQHRDTRSSTYRISRYCCTAAIFFNVLTSRCWTGAQQIVQRSHLHVAALVGFNVDRVQNVGTGILCAGKGSFKLGCCRRCRCRCGGGRCYNAILEAAPPEHFSHGIKVRCKRVAVVGVAVKSGTNALDCSIDRGTGPSKRCQGITNRFCLVRARCCRLFAVFKVGEHVRYPERSDALDDAVHFLLNQMVQSVTSATSPND